MDRIYVTLEDAVAIHGDQLSLYGGAPGIRDVGLIVSALHRPQTGCYSDLIEEAAALWESLTMHHGFADGNKRVAFACVNVFLDVNGLLLEGDEDEAIQFIYANL